MLRLQPLLRFIAFALLVAFPAQILMPMAFAAMPGDTNSVDNVRASKQGSRVQVLYNLTGEAGKKYSVTMTLRREQDSGFQYFPKKTSGDIGDGVTPGRDKRVFWDLSEEYPEGLAGDDFYFLVEAEVEGTGGGISPIVWIGGAAAVGGVAALLLLSKKNGSDGGSGTTPVTPQGFPAEPGRPR